MCFKVNLRKQNLVNPFSRCNGWQLVQGMCFFKLILVIMINKN